MAIEPTEFSAAQTVIYAAWVYRLVNGIPVTVWQGLGTVRVSTKEKLHIYVWYLLKREGDEEAQVIEYEYDVLWDGKAYRVRGF